MKPLSKSQKKQQQTSTNQICALPASRHSHAQNDAARCGKMQRLEHTNEEQRGMAKQRLLSQQGLDGILPSRYFSSLRGCRQVVFAERPAVVSVAGTLVVITL